MLPRKKVLLQEKFPSCRRTFFRNNRWNNLLPWHTTEEPSSEELGGRTFFHEIRWKNLLPWQHQVEEASSAGSNGRTFFHGCQRRFVSFARKMFFLWIPWKNFLPPVPAEEPSFARTTWSNFHPRKKRTFTRKKVHLLPRATSNPWMLSNLSQHTHHKCRLT